MTINFRHVMRRQRIVLLCMLFMVLLAYVLPHIVKYAVYLFAYDYKMLKMRMMGIQSYCPSEPMLNFRPPDQLPNNTWESLITEYASLNHSKYVVYSPFSNSGFCNRMLHSISVLLFAMVTNRTMWINWNFSENHMEEIEI